MSNSQQMAVLPNNLLFILTRISMPCDVVLSLNLPLFLRIPFCCKINMQSSNNIQDFLCKTLAYVITYELAVSLEFGMAQICYFIHSGQFLQIHEV
jgi:hypothetical protein